MSVRLNLLGKDLQGLWCLLFFYHIKLSYGRSARNHYKTVLKCFLTKTIINEEGNIDSIHLLTDW